MTKKAWLLAAMALVTQSTPSAPQPPPSAPVESHGVRIETPAGWSHNDRLIAAGGPIAMTNFGGVYAQGGFPPPGGAEIEITSVPAPPNLVEYIQSELRGGPVEPLREIPEGANGGIQAAYVESLAPEVALRTVVDYIPHGGALFKFYLTCWAGDGNEAGMIATLGSVVRGAQFQ